MCWGLIDKISALVQITAWHRTGGESHYLNQWWHICVTWPQWVNTVMEPQGHLMQAWGKAKKERKTRRSENDNTPQPLDQWTNSSFIGQQVGNCKSFTLTHYFAHLSAMHLGRRSIPLCIQHHIQLTSLSFQVSQTSHCWVTAISIFYLENPRSRS